MKVMDVKIVESSYGHENGEVLSVRAVDGSSGSFKRGLPMAGFKAGDDAVIVARSDFEALKDEAKIQRHLCDHHRVVHEAGRQASERRATEAERGMKALQKKLADLKLSGSDR